MLAVTLAGHTLRRRQQQPPNIAVVLFFSSLYADANVEQLKALLFNYDDQTTRFKRIKTWQDVGFIRVGSGKLEAMLRPSPERWCFPLVKNDPS